MAKEVNKNLKKLQEMFTNESYISINDAKNNPTKKETASIDDMVEMLVRKVVEEDYREDGTKPKEANLIIDSIDKVVDLETKIKDINSLFIR